MGVTRNIYMCHNEYHLLVTAGIILKLYCDGSKFENIIYYAYKNRRLKASFNDIYLPATIRIVPLDDNTNLKTEICEIIKALPQNFFFFHESSPINIFIISKLWRKGTKVILIQDGLKPYSIVRKRFEFLSDLRETFVFYKVLFDLHFKVNSLRFIRNYRYGRTKEIDELWLSYPLSFRNRYNKKLFKIPEISEPDILNPIKKFFLFEELVRGIAARKNVIFFITQPHINPENIKIEIEFLSKLVKRFPKIEQLLIKVHPASIRLSYELYNTLPKAFVFNTPIPAELIILSLQDSVILSGWSTALLINNPFCRFYYNYPIFGEDKLLKQFYPVNPTDHITVVDNPDEIKFPEL